MSLPIYANYIFRNLTVFFVAVVVTLSIDGQAQADTSANAPAFTLSSPDLASGSFDKKFILGSFGCTGGNVSPAIQWSNPPAGTKSFALQMHDPDAPTGSGFWHWAIYNLPASATGLRQEKF